jgi:hypothetical protein
VEEVRPGDWVVTQVQDGRIVSRVEVVTPSEAISDQQSAKTEERRG